jgi:hypothetical protein
MASVFIMEANHKPFINPCAANGEADAIFHPE